MSQPSQDAFDASRARFDEVCSFLAAPDAMGLTHGQLEARLAVDVRDLVPQLLQDHLDLRGAREERLGDVVDEKGVSRRAVEPGHRRPLQTIFGTVTVTRFAYRRRGEENLYPADAALNLPQEVHSHGLRQLAAIESTRGSFADARDAIDRTTGGVGVAKRQVEDLTRRAAVDLEAFYDKAS